MWGVGEQGQEETFGGDGYVHCLDSGDVFTGVCVKIDQTLHCMQFNRCQLYFNKAVFQKTKV